MTAPYQVYGSHLIEANTIEQMFNAASIPVAVRGALMPDAHLGYGLPIGGVLATDGVVIPYAVGVDIACRMRLSIFELVPNTLDTILEQALLENTVFGVGQTIGSIDHPVLDDTEWNAFPFLSSLHSKAVEQLGTSGTGNHFVEWGRLNVTEAFDGIQPGAYLALLSHSGSRGVGFQIANAFSKTAEALHPELPKETAHLAWLDMESEPGVEYWIAMHLAGRFAAANHEVVHQRIAQAVGVMPIGVVENHHNFAWKEDVRLDDGTTRELIVHRKGATPAGNGVLGIIPGNMADGGFVVRGRGNAASLNSASHGAGRTMSRTQAKKTIDPDAVKRYLRQHNVKLIGGDLDEAPMAYKAVSEVIQAQADLVDVVAHFQPTIVRMASPERRRGRPEDGE